LALKVLLCAAPLFKEANNHTTRPVVRQAALRSSRCAEVRELYNNLVEELL
jgi:hypothetical protein